MDQTKRSFEVVVDGQYVALGESTGTPTVKNYTSKFILPSQEAALSVVCKHLLAPYLRKKYSDFIRFRTHKLVSMTAIGRKPNPDVLQMSIEDMSVAQLSDFCILKGIMIDPYKHQNVAQTKERVAEAWRLKRQARKEADTSAAGANQKKIDALLELNELPKENDTVQLNLRERQATTAASVTTPAAAGGWRTGAAALELDEQLPPVEPDVDNGAGASDAQDQLE